MSRDRARVPVGIALIIGCLAVSCLILTAQAEPLLPALPCEFYGNVSINGIGAPTGTVITAFVNGDDRGTITTTHDGRYGGSARFDPRLIVTGTEDDRGLPIRFTVNGLATNETCVFNDGHSIRLDLTARIPGPNPTAHFIVNRSIGLAPLTILFTDTSDCVNTINRLWVFGDGNTSALESPTYTYRKAGNYTALLTVTNSTGTNTTVPGQNITIYPKGDFNHNWEVDIGDVALVAYMVVGRAPVILPDADFNENGFVDIGDAAKIAWFKVGKVKEL
ncbi:MAG: hypothetical protein STSR0009_16870 [Methanoregula sp.]